MRVCARLNEGIDSFVRITNFLRRKEIGIKSINMESLEDSNVRLNLVLKDDYSSKYIINYISKLEDVKELEVF